MSHHGPSGGILAQIAAHDESRFESSVWSLYPPPSDLDAAATIEELGGSYRSFHMGAFLDVRILAPLVRELKNTQPDVLHCHLLRANLYGRVAAHLAGTPVVVSTLRGVEDYMVRNDAMSRAVRAVERATAGLVDRYVAVSEGVRRAAMERLGLAPEKIVTVRNAAALGPFLEAGGERAAARRELGLRGDSVVIGAAGAMIERKNYPALLRMATQLRRDCPNVEIAIVGDGEERAELESLVVELGVGDVVRMPGFRSDMPRVLQAFDIFALLSFQEGLPRAVMEAMGAGLPCVVTDVGGNAEAVAHGETGFVFPIDRMEDCRQALTDLARDAELRRAMGQRARQRASRSFTAAGMAREYEALYRDLLAAAERGSLRKTA
jgi:glycosyltransferase involved in cell wall biosynthesis